MDQGIDMYQGKVRGVTPDFLKIKLLIGLSAPCLWRLSTKAGWNNAFPLVLWPYSEEDFIITNAVKLFQGAALMCYRPDKVRFPVLTKIIFSGICGAAT
ncbi:hypothetical protein GCM10028791_39590 [Echinicola sediminis]